jgi:glycosyltransferase involved in cell wall biosynthesis
MQFAIIILTKDESKNLPICLRSLEILDAEVFVVDSGSTDSTLEIARQAGCRIFTNEWVNHAHQLNWAIKNLPISAPWTMRIDADERLTPELAAEILQTLPLASPEIVAYQVRRRVFFMGRWIRHGGYYPTWLLRIWRTGSGICEERWMDEHVVVQGGKIADLQHDIIDENQKGLTFWIDKHNHYADREVKDLLGISASNENHLLGNGQNLQASQRRWVKKHLYARSPLFIRAFIYFLLRYIIGLGFLDGIQGLIFHFLQGFWYRFLVDAKIYELRHQPQSGQSSIIEPAVLR